MCAFDQGGFCSALRVKDCDGCVFCKTQQQLEEGRAAADRRIDSLPAELAEKIRQKYPKGGYA